jgi:hypothetical protein
MEFVDDSGHTFSRKLKDKIKKAQYDPEPTVQQFLSTIPINLRRNAQVQEQQVPKDQVGDEFTTEAKDIALLEKLEKRREENKSKEDQYKTKLERKQAKEAEDVKSGFLVNAFKTLQQFAPSSAQIQFLTAIASDNPVAIAKSVARLSRDQQRRSHQAESKERTRERTEKADIRREIADAKKHLEELKAKRAQKKKVVTTHKGHKKTIE